MHELSVVLKTKYAHHSQELTSKPLVLFLDEPTSGLDSTTAEELMQYLHRLTSTGLTIAAVIHQPRIEVFLGVDDVIFLGRGGRLAYYGAAKVRRPHVLLECSVALFSVGFMSSKRDCLRLPSQTPH